MIAEFQGPINSMTTPIPWAMTNFALQAMDLSDVAVLLALPSDLPHLGLDGEMRAEKTGTEMDGTLTTNNPGTKTKKKNVENLERNMWIYDI